MYLHNKTRIMSKCYMRVFSDYCDFAELRNTQIVLTGLPAWLTTIKFGCV